MQKERADTLFRGDCNCAQAVFMAFAPELGLDEDVARKIAGPFGGGIGSRGETCGAVSGALMALGFQMTPVEDLQTGKQRLKAMTGRFLKEFEEKYGSIKCKELLPYDISKPEERKKAQEEGVFRSICREYVRGSSCILQDILAAKH